MLKLSYCLFLCLLISCSKKPIEVVTNSTIQLDSVSGINATTQNVTVNLNVKWFYTSGCDVFDNFTTTQNGNVYIIQAFDHTNNTICTQDAGLKNAMYNFTSANTGNFELRFISKDNTSISHFITVN
jgi:hypothetical protein